MLQVVGAGGGGQLTIVTVCTAVSLQPPALITACCTVKLPVVAYLWVTLLPVPVVPSPKFQVLLVPTLVEVNVMVLSQLLEALAVVKLALTPLVMVLANDMVDVQVPLLTSTL